MKWTGIPQVAVVGLAVWLGFLLAFGSEIWAVGVVCVVVVLAAYAWGALPQLFLFWVVMRPLADLLIGVPVGGLSTGEIWGLVALLMESLILAGGQRRAQMRLKSLLPVIIFLALYVVLAVTRSGGLDGVERFAKIAVWMLAIPVVEKLVVSLPMRRNVERAGYALAVTGVVAALLMVAGGTFGSAYYDLSGLVSSTGAGGAQAPHAYGTLIVLSIPFILLRMQGDHERSGVDAPVLLLLGVLVIGLSLVRSVILATIIFFLVLTVLGIKRRNRSGIQILVSVLLSAGAVFVLAGDLLAARLGEFGAGLLVPSAGLGSGRVGIWGAVIRGATSSVESFLVGRGAGTAELYVRQATGMAVGAHNDVLELAADGGIILLGAYLVVLVVLVVTALRQARVLVPAKGRAVDVIAVASVSAFAVLALTNGALFYMGSMAFGVLLGLVIAGAGFEQGRITEHQSASTSDRCGRRE